MPEWIQEYWIEWLFSLIIGVFTAMFKKQANKIKMQASKIRNQEAEQKAIKLGIQALLRDRIIQSYNCYLDKGYCPIYARDNIEALYTQYHALGGNGTVTELVEKLKDMPTEIKKAR